MNWIADHWGLISLSLVGAVIVFRLRHVLFDVSSLVFWRIGWFGSTRRRIIWTVQILEVRARIAGKERPPSITLAKWYRALAGSEQRLQGNRESLEQLLTLADRAFYDRESIEVSLSSNIQTDVYSACAKLIRTWTSRRMKRSICDLPLQQAPMRIIQQGLRTP